MKMNIQALKIDIIHWLTELRDERILQKIQEIREDTDSISLSAAQEKELNLRLKEYESGASELISWKEARSNIKKRYKDEL